MLVANPRGALTEPTNKFTWQKLLPAHSTIVILAFVAWAMVVCSVGRLIFLWIYRASFQGFSAGQIMGALLGGLRFDLAIVCMAAVPACLVLHLPQRWLSAPWLRRILLAVVLAPLWVVWVILLVDLHYYGEAGRRLSYEVFTIGNDMGSVVQMSLSYTVTLVCFLIVVAGSTWAWSRYSNSLRTRLAYKPHLLAQGLWFVVVVIGGVIGFRGGLQSKTLRPSFAFSSSHVCLAHLELNPAFTVYFALRRGHVNIPDVVPSEKAVEIVQGLVSRPDTMFSDLQYPLYQVPRETNRAALPAERLNVVIMLLESWSGKYVGCLNPTAGYTPQFDRLASQGMLFSNFFATGARSPEGITSVTCSLPTFEDLRIIASSFEQDVLRGIGTILAEAGYSTFFLHAAKTGSFGFDAFSRVLGFDRFIQRRDFVRAPGDSTVAWGIYDHIALERLSDELRKAREPFCAMWFSLTSHPPYELPSDKYRVTPSSVPQHQFMDTLLYTDESIGQFFQRISTEPYFKRTVFILLADHTLGSNLRGTCERQRIPCLIYAPGRIPAKRVEAIGSQLDILPTVLDLTGVNRPHHCFGRSLLDTSRDRFAFVERGGYMGWFRDNRLLLARNEGVVGLFDWAVDPHETNDLAAREPEKTRELQHELMSFVATSKRLIRDNRLAPPAPISADLPDRPRTAHAVPAR